MAKLNKQQVWDAVNNAPPGMSSQEVLDGLIAQGHELEGYTPHTTTLEQYNQANQQPEQSLGQMASSAASKAFEPLSKVQSGVNALFKSGANVLRSGAEKTAELGAGGGLFGVPMLMGAEYLDPETKMGKVAQGLSLAAPVAGAGVKALAEAKNAGVGAESGAQLLNWLPKLPMDTAKALAADPSMVLRAKSLDEVKNAYKTFAQSHDILSGTDAFEAMQEGKSSTIPYKDIGDTAYNNIKSIQDKNDLQQALTGRQAYGELLKNKWKNPSLDFDEQLVKRRQMALDSKIEQYDPTYADLRKDYHEANVVDDLNHVLPQNTNQSPNKLALTTALGSIVGGVASGNPTAIAGALGYSAAQSPLVAKQALKGLAYAGKGIDFLNQDINIPNFGLSKLMSDERGAINPSGIKQSAPDAQFIGVQKAPGEDVMPLFNVTKPGHELEGSTVTADTLVKNNLWPDMGDINAKVQNMLKEGKSTEDISSVIEDQQAAHRAMADANRDAFVKMLKKGYRPGL